MHARTLAHVRAFARALARTALRWSLSSSTLARGRRLYCRAPRADRAPRAFFKKAGSELPAAEPAVFRRTTPWPAAHSQGCAAAASAHFLIITPKGHGVPPSGAAPLRLSEAPAPPVRFLSLRFILGHLPSMESRDK